VSLSFITQTSAVSRAKTADPCAEPSPEHMRVIGYDPIDHKVYLLQDCGDDGPPYLYFMHTRGDHVGHLVGLPSNYADEDDPEATKLFWARLEGLSRRLRPLEQRPKGLYRLSTHVVRKRAVLIEPELPAVRKYTLRAAVGRASESPDNAPFTYVTAYLRPRVELVSVHRVPNGAGSIAILRFVGIPIEIGYETDSALFLPGR
jgi:hypothetical protein